MNSSATSLTLDSPVGPLHLAACRDGLTHLLFAGGSDQLPKGDGTAAAQGILAETVRQLGEYFTGERRAFDLPLAPAGTAFQLAVWDALRTIPFGSTTSYGALACRLGRPGAARAVGAANGANPISIVVPCHRVIGGDGSLTGYGGGLKAKRILLELEANALPAAASGH